MDNNGHDRGGDAGPEGEPLFQVAPKDALALSHGHGPHHLFTFIFTFPFSTTSLSLFTFNMTIILLFLKAEDRGVAGVCFTNPLAPTASPAQVVWVV